MYPIIYKIGPIAIYSYGLMLAIAFLWCSFLAKKDAQKAGINGQKIIDLNLYLIISGIIGARLTYVLINIEDYLRNPLEIVMLHHGGLVFYGGLIIATIIGLWFLIKNKLPILKIADILVPYVALAQAIGRLGCFLNGCCYGKPTNLSWGINFPGHIERLHPTQIYESISLFLIFLILKFSKRIIHKPGKILILYFLFYSMARFIIEFYRGDNLPIFLNLTFSQHVSLVLIAISSVILIFWPKKYERI